MLKKDLKNNISGQGLVELIVAVAVIQVGLLSVWSLFLINFNAEKEAEMRIVGSNLSREGVELVKNIRDSNWLKVDQGAVDFNDNNRPWTWDKYLEAGTSSVSYDRDDLDSPSNDQLYYDSYGFYTNSNVGTAISPYKRIVSLKPICCKDLDDDLRCDNTDYSPEDTESLCDFKIGVKVVSKTIWSQSGGSREAVVEDLIYNWR